MRVDECCDSYELCHEAVGPTYPKDFQATIVANREVQREAGEPQGSPAAGTRDRKGIRYEFAKWLSGFKQVATVILADHPEWLERLDFLNRSDK